MAPEFPLNGPRSRVDRGSLSPSIHRLMSILGQLTITRPMKIGRCGSLHVSQVMCQNHDGSRSSDGDQRLLNKPRVAHRSSHLNGI